MPRQSKNAQARRTENDERLQELLNQFGQAGQENQVSASGNAKAPDPPVGVPIPMNPKEDFPNRPTFTIRIALDDFNGQKTISSNPNLLQSGATVITTTSVWIGEQFR